MDDEGELDDCDISTYYHPAKYAEIDAERGVLRIGFDNGGVDGETRIPMNEIPMNSDMAMLIRRLARALEKADPKHSMPAKAIDYLKRKGFKGRIIR